MAAAGLVYMLAVLLALEGTEAHTAYHPGSSHPDNSSWLVDAFHVSIGHLFLLRCLSADDVTWSKEGSRLDQRLPPGVEVRDGLLWFLSVEMSHNGSYTCETRDKTRLTFEVFVSRGQCPHPPELKSITQGVNDGLACKQPEIFRLNKTRSVRWMKDCQPVDLSGGHVSVDEGGFMRLHPASQRDAGIYTCLVDVTLGDRKYTSARSTQLAIDQEVGVIPLPEVTYPRQEVIEVEEGSRVELKCLAYIGYSENKETIMFWTVDDTDSDDHEELSASWNYIREGGQVYGESILVISKVPRRFLDVNISCHIQNTAGHETGLVRLRQADHSRLYTTVALCLAASLAVLGLAAAFLVFKVDLVLTHRKLLRHFAKQAPDGKLYDAYVSLLHPDAFGSASMASFLQILPERLEKQHGFSLYIRGRDDCPGEAVHDAIASTLRQCRRLIIILTDDDRKSSSEGGAEAVSLRHGQTQLCYEQKVGLHDALTRNEPRVILLEIDGPVDYSLLPESLRFIKRKQGALKWKKPSMKTNKLIKLGSNRNFWKKLRYHMPSVPAGRRPAAV